MTIAVDTSALLSVLLGEDDAELMGATLVAHAGDIVIGAASLVETRIVTRSKAGAEGMADLESLLSAVSVELVPFDPDQADIASSAWDRFGRGRHSAELNFGDCLSYAVAKSIGAMLLFKGNDFAQTDIASAL